MNKQFLRAFHNKSVIEPIQGQGKHERKKWLWYSIPFAIMATIFLLFPFWEVDDAFIVLRYAKNWVKVGEPVWNQGEDPVEGYTGFAWMTLATLLYKLGFYPLVWLRGLGVLACYGSLFLMHRIGEKAKWSFPIILGPMLFFALSPLIYTHATSGLETAFFCFVLLLGLRAYQRVVLGKEVHWRSVMVFSCTLWLCGLVRPEGVIIGSVLTGLFLWRFYKMHSGNVWKPVIGILVGLVIPGAIYFYLRWQYYGQFFPNTVYAKSYDGIFNLRVLWEATRFGIHYLSGGIAVVTIFAILARKEKQSTQEKSTEFVLFPAIGITGLLVLLGYSQTQLYMGYAFRFFAPFLPLALLGLAELANSRYDRIQWRGQKRMQWFLLVILTLQVVLWGRKMKQEVNFVHHYQAIIEEELKPVGQFLSAELPAESTVAVYMDVGAIAWYTDYQILDFGRLNNETLAHLPYGDSEVVDYFFDQNPIAAVFTSFHPDTLNYIPEAHQIQSDKRFEKYKRVKKFGTNTDYPYYQFVYFRQTNPTPAR